MPHGAIKICMNEGYVPENLLMQEPFEEEENFLNLDETFNPEDYENAWVEMMIPITATISYTTKPSMTTEEAWQQWYCRKGDLGHPRIQRYNQPTSSHRAEERSAWEKLQDKYWAIEGHHQNLPNDSVRVDSYFNTVKPTILNAIEKELSDQEIARTEVCFEIAGPMATNAESKIKKQDQYWSKRENKSRDWRTNSRSPFRRDRSSSVDRWDQRGGNPNRSTTRSRDDSVDRCADRDRNYNSSRDRTIKETGADYRSVNPSTLAPQSGVEKLLKPSGEPMPGHVTKNKDLRKQEPSKTYAVQGDEEWAEGWGD